MDTLRAQFEAWLSLQQCSTEGVRPAPKDATRCTVVSIHNAATTSMAGDLLKMWGADEMKPEAAVAVLSKPDIAVTNQSDKDGQLPKVLKLSDKVKEALA